MMDTTTKLSAGTRPSPSPFTSSVEHHELTRALLLPPSSESLCWAQHPNQSFIPTAVPISSINNGGECPIATTSVLAHATQLLGQEGISTATASSSVVHNASTRTTITNSKESHFESNNDNNDIIVRPLPSSQSSHDHSSATQHYYNLNPNTGHDITESRLRLANVHGTIQTENEIADVIRAQRNIQSTVQYHDTDAINYANVKAAKQAAQYDEGLTAAASATAATTDYHNGRQCVSIHEGLKDEKKKSVGDDEMMKQKMSSHDKCNGSNGSGGYDVQEYNVAEGYKTSEYNITEYRSVYE